MEQKPVRTKGNVIVNELKVGDTLYEFEYGYCIKSVVKTLPVREENPDGDGYWSWKSETEAGRIIDYGVSEKYTHYSPNLYDYMAYSGCTMI